MILDEIVLKKKQRLKGKDYLLNGSSFEKKSLYDCLKKDGLSIIGELKKASPSKGVIDETFNYLEILEVYNECVDCISVLTEEDYFLGKKEYLTQVKRNTDLPVLRKDFIIKKQQVLESYYLGADAILLIVAILTDEDLINFYEYAMHLGLDVIVEAHDKNELERALLISPKIIGINNRNLKDFSVDLKTTTRLKELIPSNILVVSESGIRNKIDIASIGEVDGVLVGESFMRCNEKYDLAKELKEAYET